MKHSPRASSDILKSDNDGSDDTPQASRTSLHDGEDVVANTYKDEETEKHTLGSELVNNNLRAVSSHHSTISERFKDATGSPNGIGGDIEQHPNAGNSEKDFIVAWDGSNDPEDPRTMSKARKWIIVIVVATCSICV